MHYKSLLVLATLSGYCYAQQTAEDVVSSIDSITQGLLDSKVLVDAISADNADEATQTMISKYTDTVNAVSVFNNGEASRNVAEAEKEQICSSFTNSADQHILLLDALVSKHDTVGSVYQASISSLVTKDESVVDEMSFKVSGMAPACQDSARESLDALAKVFPTAMSAYEQ